MFTRSHDKCCKNKPSTMMKAENMAVKLGEEQKEIYNLRIEVKQKETTIDFLRSEKERILMKTKECEEIRNTQKKARLDEIVQLKKERDDHMDRIVELERFVEEYKRRKNHFVENRDSHRAEIEELKQSAAYETEANKKLRETVANLQKLLTESELKLEAKESMVLENMDKRKGLKNQIQALHERLSIAEQTVSHERILRSRLDEDNAALIRHQADLEAELTVVKSSLIEEEARRSCLETIHLNLVDETSNAKAEVAKLRAGLEELEGHVNTQTELAHDLTAKLAVHEDVKNKEKNKMLHFQKRLEQKEERLKAREKENIAVQRDNAFMKDQIIVLQHQIASRDEEVETLKGKAQQMNMAVEEFIENKRTAGKLESQRWKQLTQLAQGMESLNVNATSNPET